MEAMHVVKTQPENNIGIALITIVLMRINVNMPQKLGRGRKQKVQIIS